jgi:hypothetical protein
MTDNPGVAGFGGKDFGKWLALLGILASLGLVPKSWKVIISTAGSIYAAYRLLKWLGVI